MPKAHPASPISAARVAIVGSGVMAEAIVAGLLRGGLVAPDRIVASHPRAERRGELGEQLEAAIEPAASQVAPPSRAVPRSRP